MSFHSRHSKPELSMQLRARDGAFDDFTTEIMGEAFDAACKLLGKISEPSRNAVADRIVDAATNGERDPIRLREAGMAALRPHCAR